MKKTAVLMTIAIFGISMNASAETTETKKIKNYDLNFSVSYSPYYYKWEEKNGPTEKGWIHGLRTEAGVKINKIVYMPYIMPSFTIYGGDVKYDGETWSGIKVKTRTNFNGWNAELNLGYKICSGKNFNTMIYAGAGKEVWKRSIDSTTEGTGYTEKWSQKYIKAGIKPEYVYGNYYVYGNLYLKYPWDVENKVGLFDVKVKPDEKVNYGFELGGGIKGIIAGKADLFASAFYEREKFGKSSPEYSEIVDSYLYQPESKRKTYGFRIGIKF